MRAFGIIGGGAVLAATAGVGAISLLGPAAGIGAVGSIQITMLPIQSIYIQEPLVLLEQQPCQCAWALSSVGQRMASVVF